MKDDLEEFKKRRDSHGKGYECNSLDYIEDEDCGDLRMVSKGLDSIENSWVLDSALCFFICFGIEIGLTPTRLVMKDCYVG